MTVIRYNLVCSQKLIDTSVLSKQNVWFCVTCRSHADMGKTMDKVWCHWRMLVSLMENNMPYVNTVGIHKYINATQFKHHIVLCDIISVQSYRIQ